MNIDYSFALTEVIKSFTAAKNREIDFMILQELHNTGSIGRAEYEKELRLLSNHH